MKPRSVSATEAKNQFGAVLREVSRTGGPILVEKAGRPVAVIVSVDAYEQAEAHSRFAASDPSERVRAAFGMWSHRKDIDDAWLHRGRERWRSEWADD